jgi:hypothetical protein
MKITFLLEGLAGARPSSRVNFVQNWWEDLKITAKDAKGAKKNIKTSGYLFYNILNNIMQLGF